MGFISFFEQALSTVEVGICITETYPQVSKQHKYKI